MQWQSQFWKLCRGKSSVGGNWSVQSELLLNTTALNQFWSAMPLITCTVMGELKGAPAVHFNFPLLIFTSTQLSKLGLPLPVSLFLRNRGGLVNGADPLPTCRWDLSWEQNAWLYTWLWSEYGTVTECTAYWVLSNDYWVLCPILGCCDLVAL